MSKLITNTIRHTGGSTDNISLDSSGKVGIGTSGPTDRVHINSGTSNGCLKLESTDSGADLYIKDSDGEVGISANGDNLIFRTTSSSTAVSYTHLRAHET